MTSKKNLSERDICTKYIIPALKKSGWNIEKQVREEVYFTDGRIYVKGDRTKRGKRKRADYILNRAKGSQKSMPKINQSIITNTIIVLPPIKEQTELI